MLVTKNIEFEYDPNTRFSFPDISLNKGEELLLLGASGSGKTTYLQILSLLLQNTKGKIFIDGTEINILSRRKRDLFRFENIGLVFQQMHFINSLNVFENIALASRVDENILNQILEDLNIQHLIAKKIHQLSVGEKQRVGIARALAMLPRLILADEPTASLDDHNAFQVIKMLREQSQKFGTTLLIATHDQRVKNLINNVVQL